MNRLVSVIIGQDCQDTIKMCLESVKESDSIIYLDGYSTDNTIKIVQSFAADNDMSDGSLRILHNKFNKKNPNAISEQRNFYLDELKDNYKDNYCLVLDADEILDTDGIKNIKEWLKESNLDDGIACLRMRHLMYNLGYEDSTQEIHHVPNRLFKVSAAKEYPKGEHTILNGKMAGITLGVVVWHLGYVGGVWDVKKRYDQQTLRNSGHPKDFLNNWNKQHMLGRYPVKQVNPIELPEVILKNFGIDKDELYFEGRGLEVKHGIMVKQWNDFFTPTNVADFGCGIGPFMFYWEMICSVEGHDYSEYAAKNKICKSNIWPINLNNENIFIEQYDLATVIDVLEHIEYKNIDTAIENIISSTSEYILVSIPYKGTHNCDNDPTHIIKENQSWWVKQFTDKGLKEVEVPEHFLFKEQLLIFRK